MTMKYFRENPMLAIISNHLLSLTLGLSNVKLIIVDLTVFSSQWPSDTNNPSN